MKYTPEDISEMDKVNVESHLENSLYALILEGVDVHGEWLTAEQYWDHIGEDVSFPHYEKNGNIHLYSWARDSTSYLAIELWMNTGDDEYNFGVQVENDSGLLQAMSYDTLNECLKVIESLMWVLGQFPYPMRPDYTSREMMRDHISQIEKRLDSLRSSLDE